MLTVTLAMACSCTSINVPTPERCATAARVFSGTIVGYDWPLAYQLMAQRPVTVHLKVDTVWAGDVPDQLVAYTGLGGGDCGIAEPPGTHFVVCDDKEGRADVWFGSCTPPAFGVDAEDFLAALSPGHDPQPLGGWETAESEIGRTWERQRLLLLPVGGVLLGALTGRLSRRWGSPRPPTVWAPVALAAGFVLVGVLSHGVILWVGPTWDSVTRWRMALLIGGGMLGGLLGGRAGRRGGSILVAAVLASLALRLSFSRLHLPIQWPDATACSIDRARAFFAALPPGRPMEVLRAHEDMLPRSCVDLGLGTIQLEEGLDAAPCVSFEDGTGGGYAMCASSDEHGMLDPTSEPRVWYGFGGA